MKSDYEMTCKVSKKKVKITYCYGTCPKRYDETCDGFEVKQ